MHSFEVIRLKSNSKTTHLIEKLFHEKKQENFHYLHTGFLGGSPKLEHLYKALSMNMNLLS